jgi:hypothetical protein
MSAIASDLRGGRQFVASGGSTSLRNAQGRLPLRVKGDFEWQEPGREPEWVYTYFPPSWAWLNPYVAEETSDEPSRINRKHPGGRIEWRLAG